MQRLQPLMRRALSILAFGASLAASGIAAPASATAPTAPLHQSSAPVTLRVAMPAPGTLDPVQVSRFDPNTRDLIENLFVGLTRFDPHTGQIEPMLATSWTVSDDELTWTFELRTDIQWVRAAAGQITAVRPIVAGDIVYAFERACDPLRPSPVTANLMVIKGCKTVANAFPEVINDLFIAREMGVRATGPHTLEIDLLFPASYFLTLLSTPELRPLARESASDAADWSTAAIMTSGPYAITGWNSAGLSLVRNPFWPDAYAGNVENIDVTFTGEATTPAGLIGSQRADMARLDSGEIAAASSLYPDLLHVAEGTSLTMLAFSFDRATVSTPEARRALSYAIDRDALVRQFFPGRAQAVSRFTPSGVVAAPEAPVTSLYDPAKAQMNFGAAGYGNCDGVQEPIILIMPDDDPLWTDVGQFIIQQWVTTLGCNPALFEIKTLSRTLLIELSHATYDPEKVTRSPIWFAVWSADYPDANAWIGDALHCHYGYMRTGRECDQSDALIDRAAVTMDPATRAELYTEAEAVLFGSAGTFPVTPLFISTAAWLQQPWLANVNSAGPARFDLWTLDAAQQPQF